MVGGTGNDTYEVDDIGDKITESGPATDLDRVDSAITYTLGANLENLRLVGSEDIDGTGNSLNNVITGNFNANTLSGLAGNDTLNGNERRRPAAGRRRQRRAAGREQRRTPSSAAPATTSSSSSPAAARTRTWSPISTACPAAT